jgi:hypothetical protein
MDHAWNNEEQQCKTTTRKCKKVNKQTMIIMHVKASFPAHAWNGKLVWADLREIE